MDRLGRRVPEVRGSCGKGSVAAGLALGPGGDRRLTTEKRRLREGVWWWSRLVRYKGAM